MERDQCWTDRDWCAWLEFVFSCLVVCLPTGFPVALWHLWVLLVWFDEDEILQSLKPKDRELEFHPCANTCIERDYFSFNRTVWNWSLFLAHKTYWHKMFDFRKCTEFILMSTSSLQGLLQNQNLELILICIVVLCFPHDQYCLYSLVCHECTRSNAPRVCHMLLSFTLPHEQVCSRTIKYQVYRYMPNMNISQQFVSKLWTILQLIQFLLFYIHTWRRDFVQTVSCFIRKFAISFHAFLRKTFHVTGPWRYCFGIKFLLGFCFWKFFIATAEILDSNILL